MSRAAFEPAGDSVYRVSGELDFESVPSVWKASISCLDGEAAPRIDLGGVGRVDSAALALVLEWVRWGIHHQRPVRFLNVPEKLLALARISEVSRLIDGTTGVERRPQGAASSSSPKSSSG
jgi:phospholipid transport system transporter-binding protein